MSAFSSAYNAASSATGGSGLLGTGISFLANRHSARQQQSATREMYQNRYQWAVADMKKAGLNPILAAKGPGSGGAMAAQAPTENPFSAGSQISLNRANKQAVIELGKKHGADAALAAQMSLESQQRERLHAASADGVIEDNKERVRQQTFFENNPWMRNVKYIMDNLGAAGAGIVGAFLGYGAKKGSSPTITPDMMTNTKPPQTVPPSIQYRQSGHRNIDYRERSKPGKRKSKQRGGPAEWAEKWSKQR